VQKVVIVIPCFNEANRLKVTDFITLASNDNLRLLFVDDGSEDRTMHLLKEICQAGRGNIDTLTLPTNGGKAEAVRQGMLTAMEGGAEVVGYIDADLSTPIDETTRLIKQLDQRNLSVIMGSRVAMLGTKIARSPIRHYPGRVFASAASLILKVAVYDTQCGAKFFRNTHSLYSALERKFLSRWAFDIELLGRLLIGSEKSRPVPLEEFIEVPLRIWTDFSDSKLKPPDAVKMLVDLFKIALDFSRLRRKVNKKSPAEKLRMEQETIQAGRLRKE